MSDLDSSTLDALRTRLLAWFGRRVRDRATAEDLVQEVFVRVHERGHQLRDGERLGAWIDRIAARLLADHHRRSRPVASLDEEPAQASDPPAAELNGFVASWLRPLLDRLAPDDREALELAELQQLPQVDLARRLGLSPSGARSRVQRARRRLRGQLLRCCQLELDRRGNVLDCERRRGAATDCDADCTPRPRG